MSISLFLVLLLTSLLSLSFTFLHAQHLVINIDLLGGCCRLPVDALGDVLDMGTIALLIFQSHVAVLLGL